MDTKPSTHYHLFSTKAFNLRTRVLNVLGYARIDLSEQALLAEARRQTGLEDFGREHFLPGLRALLASLDADADLNPFGRVAARKRIVGSLKNLLWANACFKAHPEILQRQIAAPMIIIGPHRSGTTRLHRMLSTDTRLQHLKTWEAFNPAPRIGRPESGLTERREEVRQSLGTVGRLYPGVFAAHPMEADAAEEENLIVNHCFCGFSPLGLYNISGYYQWFIGHDRTEAYRFMADMLKLISWSKGEPENKRWVLKNPQYMLDLDALLAVFPDAKLVFTHRDPLKTVGSLMSLMWRYAVQHTDLPCRALVRDVWLDFCVQGAHRCVKMRDNIPASQQMDIYYDDMERDWRVAMQRIYGFVGMEFSDNAENAMIAWMSRSERKREHGDHRYALEDFGISPQEVDAHMMFFRERYAIPYEKSPPVT